MGSGLDGILLGRESVSIKTHRVQYIEALQAFKTGKNIGSDIPQRVADMQTRARRIRKHVKYIVFRLVRDIGGFEGFIFPPVLLPLFFDLPEIVIHIMLRMLMLLILRLRS